MKNPSVQNFRDCSDAELSHFAAAGSDEAAIELIARYIPLVKSRAASYVRDRHDHFEDLCQEGMIGLLVAVRTFDEKKSSFSTFARLCIDRVLTTVSRTDFRKKRIPYQKIVAMDGVDETRLTEQIYDIGAENPESIVIRKETLEQLKSRVAAELTELESAVLIDYVGGKSYEEIALRSGISTKAVDNALQRIRRKFR